MSTRRSILTTVLTFAIATIGMAAGASMATHVAPVAPDSADVRGRSEDVVKDAADARGGPIERVHGASHCDLADGAALTGNWTHGDYVSAVALDGKTAQVREAAQSSCGKPVAAGGHGRSDQAAGRTHADSAGDHSAAGSHAASAEHSAAGDHSGAGSH